MNLLVVGASAGLGRALAEEGARRGHSLFLCARDGRDLQALAASLSLQTGIDTAFAAADIALPRQRCELVRRVRSWKTLDAILLPIGVSRTDDNGMLDERIAAGLLDANFFAQVCLLQALWPRQGDKGPGAIVGFGSIASIRGRRRNVVYAAAKRALASYFESLRAIGEDTGISIQFYMLGYMATGQSLGKKLLLPIVPPERVARIVLDRLGRKQAAMYLPRWWAAIAIALRALPWTVYRRLDF
jgi:short-subunit dehydrogenase